ncbi:hypothetical protein AUTU_28800 [Aureibacter tunicatorum]|nr:hypothetical protein AUTU_28800 [Aureibacter tunicatorum]
MSVSSCFSAQPVSRLKALNRTTSWYFGNEVSSQNKNGIELRVAYTESYGETLVFDIELINNSDKSVCISPNQCYYVALDKDTTDIGALRFAIDPEVKILELDKKIEAGKAAQANHVLYSLFSVTLDIVEDAATLTEEKTEEQRDKEFNERQEHLEFLNDESDRREEHVYSLNSQKSFWVNSTLRRTDVESGYTIKGQIFIKRNIKAEYYKLYIPIGNQRFAFDYKQVLY